MKYDLHTLGEAYELFQPERATKIPFIVWLFENPESPLCFPGSQSLRDHDCVHVVTGLKKSLYDEAFVIGLVMGNDRRTTVFHAFIYKLISRFLYPNEYKFNKYHLMMFDQAYMNGSYLRPGLHRKDWSTCWNQSIKDIRKDLGIKISSLQMAYRVMIRVIEDEKKALMRG